jgi:hypothetical protein
VLEDAWRGIDRRVVPTRGDCREPYIQTVEELLEASKKWLTGNTARAAATVPT